VRDYYIYGQFHGAIPSFTESDYGHAFDRALASHVASVIEQLADEYVGANRTGATKARPHASVWLRARAEQYRTKGTNE
jgi:hypothetical protein